MVLISLAIVFGGLGALSLSNSGDDEAATDNTSATTTAATVGNATPPAATTGSSATDTSATSSDETTASASSGTSTSRAAGSVDKAISVQVLNNSNVTGLAAKTATTLTGSGWTNVESANYSRTDVATTTVYYGKTSGEKEAAEEIAKELGVSAQPRFADIVGEPAGVIVIITS
ncbi:LytR C-terminal domain-containing protein [Antrihabitans sp. YC3-6]|uniref:LytR C-terminal domain-containing protein n=2 Tax=Antrihabitans stalagmiti TaxID=2799499 RepID=A0A934U3F1_9NOCA|nr:LytR C-terminal domain-containing protein [Antrihabitans stalagmiti]MBJ8339630.1 LytR C-terminal domain-containing protein [Antrihabitans stalagmiti]